MSVLRRVPDLPVGPLPAGPRGQRHLQVTFVPCPFVTVSAPQSAWPSVVFREWRTVLCWFWVGTADLSDPPFSVTVAKTEALRGEVARRGHVGSWQAS